MHPSPLLIGPGAAALLPPPGGLSPAWSTAGTGLMMVIWWMAGAGPLAPLVLAPVSGLGSHPLVFLCLGGFLIGRTIERLGAAPAHRFGGLALARLIDRSGLAAWIGAHEVLAANIVDVGEMASSTALAAVFLPVAGAAAVGFMLLVATPPNYSRTGSTLATFRP